MIFQKFTTTFTAAFAGGTGSILGGIFFEIYMSFRSFWNSTVDIFLERLNITVTVTVTVTGT